MTCVRIPSGIITLTNSHRLRLSDGTCVFMDWHVWCGPAFFKDRDNRRMLDEWWENPLIVDALDWFIARGHRA